MWDKVLSIMHSKMDEISFLTWIKSMDCAAVGENSITLHAPSMFNKGIIEARYFSLLKEAIESVTSKEYELEIIVEDKKTDSKGNEAAAELFDYKELSLNPEYTFDSFIVSGCNEIGLKAAKKVAVSSSESYNPLFVYGGVGTGKTHLMQAIGNYVLAHDDSAKVGYITVKDFVNDLISHIKDDKDYEFIKRFEYLDLFILDDLQYLVGKERTQEELCSLLNKLIRKNCKIVIGDSKPPENIMVLRERLTSLLEVGAVVKLEQLDVKLKEEALDRYCHLKNIVLSKEAGELIINTQFAGMREFKGAVNRIKAVSEMSGREIDIDMVEECLSHF